MRDYPYSLDCDGVNDYVGFGNVYSFERTDKFSYGGYFRMSRSPIDIGTNFRLHSKSNAAGTGGWCLTIFATDGTMGAFLMNSSTNRIWVTLTEVPRVGVWYFFTVTYDGSSAASGMKFYFTEVGKPLTAVASSTITQDNLSATSITTDALRIGTRIDSGLDFYGEFQACFIATDELTLAQVQNIYYNDTWPASTASLWLGPNAVGKGATVFDEVGANNGTIVGAFWSRVTAFAKRPVVRNEPFSVIFNGVADRVTFADDPALAPAAFTAEVYWIPTAISGSRDVAGKWTNSNTALQSWLITQGSTGLLSATVNIGGTAIVTPTNGESALIVRPYNFYHIVVTHDGVTLTLYVNGRKLSEIAAAGQAQVQSAVMHLGARAGSSNAALGLMSLFRFYGIAATPAQVRSLYFDNELPAAPIVEALMTDGAGLTVTNTGSYAVNGVGSSITWTTSTPFNTRALAGARSPA